MGANRKAAEKIILEGVQALLPDGANTKLYTDLFKKMNNAEFDTFMKDLKSGKAVTYVTVPNGHKTIKLDVPHMLKVGKKMGIKFHSPITYTNNETGDAYKPPLKQAIYNVYVRRASQTLSKKMSTPKSDKKMDLATGQVTGDDASSKLTLPEIQTITSLGLKETLIELAKYRGGDIGAKNALSASLFKTGQADNDVIDQYATGVVSSKTLKAYFNAALIKTNITEPAKG